MQNFSEEAKEFVREMLPKPGVAGVDIYSAAWKDMLAERFPDGEYAAFVTEVKDLIRLLGEEGFGILS